jgi:SAM-dependent methyltransferase
MSMTSVQRHYEELLAPIYVWMAGGLESGVAAGTQDVAALVPGRGVAIDLGAGFGMHSIPLARGGYDVVALDTSAQLLAVLRSASEGLAVRAIEADLTDFRSHVPAPASLIVCLGDTLTHLRDVAQVERLVGDVAESLRSGGRAVFTFRDYTRPPTGVNRFIPVRSDAERIHTCFLEEQPERIVVHDILHERRGASWPMKVSSYPKLRLAPDVVERLLRDAGLVAEVTAGPRGMVQVNATRPS